MGRSTTSTLPPPPPPPPHEPTTPINHPLTSLRSLHQLSIFLLGSTCLLATTALTRKAIWRRHLRHPPRLFTPNTNPHEYFSPFSDACQALNLATLNCASLGIMLLGGGMWAFDLAGLEEARAVLRRRLGYERIFVGGEEVPCGIGEVVRRAGEVRVRDEEDGVQEGKR